MTRTTKCLLFSVGLVTWAMLLPPGCKEGGKKSESFKHSPPDTILTILVFKNGAIGWDAGYRLRKDSFILDRKDSVSRWLRKSLYFRPFIDTVRNNLGIAVKDSSGKYQMRLAAYVPIRDEDLFLDGNINLDSLSRAHPPK